MLATTYLGSHFLNGPFIDNDQLPSLSGVYVITTLDRLNRHLVLDVGESENIRERISTHDRTSQWLTSAMAGLYAWTHYCDERNRMIIESALRLAYSPACGIK